MNPVPGREPVLPIELQNVTVVRSGRTILNDLSLRVSPGDFLAVTGPNGAGKSHFLLVLCGLQKPCSGSVTWANGPLSVQARTSIGVAFQTPVVLNRSVVANVIFALRARQIPRTQESQRAWQLLSDFGLSDPGKQPARQLSGGESQRLSLACALAGSPPLIVLDEPLSHLDAITRDRVSEILLRTHENGSTIVLISHDGEDLVRCANHRIHLRDGVMDDEQIRSPREQVQGV